MIIIPLLIALVYPLILIPVEYVLPYPYIVEEIAKLSLVFLVFKASNKDSRNFYLLVVLAACLFSISETIFYLLNFLKLASMDQLLARIIWVTTLHVSTMLIMAIGVKKYKILWILFLVISMLIHYFYNSFQ